MAIKVAGVTVVDDSRNATVESVSSTGTVTGSNLNVSNWDTAFGWGDHAGLYQAADVNIVSDANYAHITVTTSSVSDGTNTFSQYVLPSDVVQDASYVHTDNNYTTAEQTKVGFLSVTQAVDLDAIETRVNELDASVVLMGTWDASSGSFPTSTKAGESWIVSVSGTVDGQAFTVNDRIVAIVAGASTTIYAANWHKLDYTDAVLSVNGSTGAVDLTGVYEPADATILKDADIGVNVQAYNANYVVDAGYVHTDNNYTTAEQTKLAGIEAGATADQTAAEIKTAYESNADTNAYTDAEVTKLAGIEAGAQVNVATNLAYTAATRVLSSSTGTDATLPEVVAAGTSGLMTGADKTKIDGIEAGAQVNVATNLGNTASGTSLTITSSTGSSTDLPAVTTTAWGVMTDEDKTKLDGIATNANNYSLPAAADGTRGGVQIGYVENAQNYPVELSAEKMFVNVPWTDTTYTSSDFTLDGLSDTTITANSSGEILKWNGTAWVNNTLAEAGIQPAGSYLTSYTETDTLDSVTGRGATTTNNITVGTLNATDASFTGTGAVTLPTGSTAQQPTPSAGMLRFNSETTSFEGYNGTQWGDIGGATAQFIYTKTNFTATSAQTTFPVSYTVGYVDVWLNGVKLKETADYIASNGTSIVLTVGAALNDEIEVLAYKAFTLVDGLLSTDIGSTVQAYDVNTAKLDTAQTWTADQIFAANVNLQGELQLNASAGIAGQVLTSQGTGADPIWSTIDIANAVIDGGTF